MQSSQQRDKKWKWLNEDLQKFIKAGDFYSMGSTYYEMANFVKEEGKDSSPYLELAYKMRIKFQNNELMNYKKFDVCIGVEIISAKGKNNACDACKQLDGKVFPIDEALLKNPLPVKDCTHEYGCRCVYGGVVDK